MIEHKERLQAFVELGNFFRMFCEINEDAHPNPLKSEWQKEFNEAIVLASHKNGWFTEENVLFQLKVGGVCLLRKIWSIGCPLTNWVRINIRPLLSLWRETFH